MVIIHRLGPPRVGSGLDRSGSLLPTGVEGARGSLAHMWISSRDGGHSRIAHSKVPRTSRRTSFSRESVTKRIPSPFFPSTLYMLQNSGSWVVNVLSPTHSHFTTNLPSHLCTLVIHLVLARSRLKRQPLGFGLVCLRNGAQDGGSGEAKWFPPCYLRCPPLHPIGGNIRHSSSSK